MGVLGMVEIKFLEVNTVIMEKFAIFDREINLF